MILDTLETEIKRTTRGTPPAHFILKINSFTQLLEILKKTGDTKYESDEFEAAEYKWKLVVYPNGNEKGNGEGHISMYVATTDNKAIPRGCRVNALLNLFVYDLIQDKYLTIQDGKVKHYHVLKTEHGFDQLLSLAEFNDARNGYLVNDCCAFGAEVHVIKNTVKVNEFSVLKYPPNASFTWKICKFSMLQNEYYDSDTFDVGGYKWKLRVYPKGNLEAKDRCLSLFLVLDPEDSTKGQGVYAECKVLVKDQIQGRHSHELTFDSGWFKIPGATWGYKNFMLLSDLYNNSAKGYVVNDCMVVEAKITLVSSVHDLS